MARLGEICTKITDGSHNPPQGVSNSEYLMLSSKNIYDDEITFDDPRYLSKESYEVENKRTRISTGDILLTIVGTVGRAAVVSVADKNICLQRSVAVIKPKHEIVDSRYLMYQLQGMRTQLEQEARGVAQKGIYLKQVENLQIKIPSRNEQMQIAENLDKVCKLIALRKEQLVKLDQMVKSRFIELFGHPVTNERCWEQVPLSACVESIDNGKSFVCDSEARKGEWPAVLKLSAATYGFYRPEENKAMLDENQFVEDAAVHVGDLLFTRKNTPELVGMCAYVYETPGGLMMPDLIFRLNTSERCNKIFLWKLINHDLFRNRIQAISTGSAKSMSNISKERLLNLEIILPPIALQEHFAAFVEKTDKSKFDLQQSLEKLEMLKKSLMQKYFG